MLVARVGTRVVHFGKFVGTVSAVKNMTGRQLLLLGLSACSAGSARLAHEAHGLEAARVPLRMSAAVVPSVGSYGSWGYAPSTIPSPSHPFAELLAKGTVLETRSHDGGFLLLKSASSIIETRRLEGMVPWTSTHAFSASSRCATSSMFTAGRPSLLRTKADCSGLWEVIRLPGSEEGDPIAVVDTHPCPDCAAQSTPAIVASIHGKAWWTLDREKFRLFSWPTFGLDPSKGLVAGERPPFEEDTRWRTLPPEDSPPPPPYERTWLFDRHVVWKLGSAYVLCVAGRIETSVSMRGTEDGLEVDLPARFKRATHGWCREFTPGPGEIRFDEVGGSLFVSLDRVAYRLSAEGLDQVPKAEVPALGAPSLGMPTFPTVRDCQGDSSGPHIVGRLGGAPVYSSGEFSLRGQGYAMPLPSDYDKIISVGHFGRRALAFSNGWLEAFESDDDGETWIAVGGRVTSLSGWMPRGSGCWIEPQCSALGCVVGPVVRLGWDLPRVPRPRKRATPTGLSPKPPTCP